MSPHASTLIHIRRASREWLDAAADLLFPPSCSACQSETAQSIDDIQVCGNCRSEFVDAAPPCHFCGAGLARALEANERCIHCRDTKFKFQTVVRLGHYDGPLRPAILAAKQLSGAALAIHLGRLLARVRATELEALNAEVIVSVPAHWTRRGKHGHNSPDLLASEVARQLKRPVANFLLTRTRPTRPQSELPPTERFDNVRGAFQVPRHPDLANARVLLIDDVLTTGATANEAAKTLLEAGAAMVAVAVLARATGKN